MTYVIGVTKQFFFFIISRRHDMTQTRELLRKHLAKLKALGFDKNPPTFSQTGSVCKLFSQGSNIVMQGAVDKYERLIIYYKIAKDLPKENTLQSKYGMLFWDTMYRCDIEPLRYIRNGMVIIVDFEGFGWKNLDLSSEAKDFYSAMNGLFPRRIRNMYIINTGAIFRFALKAGKFILSAKIMKRIVTVDKKSLKDLIPDKWLLKEYGGSCTMTLDDMLTQMSSLDRAREYRKDELEFKLSVEA